MAAPEPIEIRAELVERSWLRRTLRLSGAVEATVEYLGHGIGERVRLNGREVARAYLGLSRWAPTIEFDLPAAEGLLPACFEVEVEPYLGSLVSLQLTVAGAVVYRERNERAVPNPTATLPIPAAPPSDPQSLPLPATAPAPEPSELPVPAEPG